MRIFITIILLSAVQALFSQEFANIVSYRKDKKIVVTFDLVNTAPQMVYDIKLRFTDSTGKTISPRTISGDLGKVSRGKNKMITWDVTRDQKDIPEKLKPVLEVTRSQYMPKKNRNELYEKPGKKSGSRNRADGALNGMYFGANIGLYVANDYTANYFNGTGVNSIGNIINNQYYNTEIKKVLNNQDFSLDTMGSLPQNMKYDPAIMVGFLARYYFNNKSALFIEFNSARLKTADKFTLNIDSVDMSFSNDKYVSCDISGSENRFDLNLCWYQAFGRHRIFKPYAELGLNFNNTQIKKNEIKIRSLTYSIMNPSRQYYQTQDGGVGYGYLAGGGLLMKINQNFAFDTGFQVCMKKIGLSGYSDVMKPDMVFYIRMILLTFALSGSEESRQAGPEDINK